MISVGDKVVCVDDGPCCCKTIACDLKGGVGISKGNIYVIEGVKMEYYGLSVKLIGVNLPTIAHNNPNWMNFRRFRKLEIVKAQTEHQQEAQND